MKHNPKINNKEAVRIIAVGVILMLVLFFSSDILNLFTISPTQAAAISLRGTSKIGSASNGRDVTLTFDTGGNAPQTGDVVFLWGGRGNSSDAQAWGPITTGYTAIATIDSTGPKFGVWYKVMGGTPDTQVQGEGGGSTSHGVVYGAYVIDGSTLDLAIFDQTAVSTGELSSWVPDGPAITTQTAGAWVITHAANSTNDASRGTVTNYTLFTGASVNEPDDFNSESAYRTIASPGTEDPPAWSAWSAGIGGAITIALKPKNDSPALVIDNPPAGNTNVAEGANYSIQYDLSDGDSVATVDFYYDTNNDGVGGTAIAACQDQVEGTNATCSFNTNILTVSTAYYIYGVASDGVNPNVTTVSSGTITVNDAPALTVTQPDGISDTIAQDASYNITYSLSDSDNVVTVAFYYDTNNSGLDGNTISGACAIAAEGTNSTCTWNTTSVTPGSYYIYGITSDGMTQVNAYSSGTVTINSRPTLSVSQPDGTSDTIAQDASYNIAYSLSDPDNVVTAAFYYDTNNSGLDGTTITGACATAVEGTTTCSWDTTGITPGLYYVYGKTNDGTNPQVSAYSPGQITINSRPTISVSQPDGASDTVTQGDLYNITYSLSDTDDIITAAFYYDTNNSGLDGNTISGACAIAIEGSNVTCSWDTSGASPGIYYVYGIANDGFNSVSAYSSGQITINAPPTPNITVSATGNQTSSMTVPSTDQYVGGAFTFQRSSGSATVSQIIISETGSVNAQTNLSNLKLYYETAGTCSFEGTEASFNVTPVSFNSSQKATATGSMPVGASQVCVYATLNVGSGAGDTQTLEIQITDPSTEVTASAGTVSPSTAVAITGTTTLSEIPIVTVTSVSPSTGTIGGNTSVTVSGSNFQSGATVTFDGISATNTTFVNSNTITAKTPAHAAGTIDVTVTNLDATAGTLFNGFTYVGAPTVNLTASPTTIFSGESFVMNWSTTNADSCNATGAWLGVKATSGSENITPTSSATYVLDCTGVGGSESDSVYVLVLAPQVIPGASGILFRFDGYSYPGGRVIIYDNSAPFSQLPSDSSGKFSTIFRLTSTIEKHLFSIIAYDKEGNPSPNKTFPSELYFRGGLTDILVAPTIVLNKRALNKKESLEVSGYATPNNKVKIEIDGKLVGEIAATRTGYYALSVKMSSLADGDHRARVLQANSSQVSDYSLLKIFRVAELFVANSDLNNDGKLNISDWSIFLSSWSSREEALRRKVDLNSDGKINIFDLSIFLSSFRKR